MFTMNPPEMLQVTGILYVYAFVFVYFLCLFVASRERLYLSQGLFSLALLANTLVTSYILRTWGLEFLMPDSASGRITAWPWLVCCTGYLLIASGTVLFRDFVLSKVYFPRIDRGFKIMLGILPVVLALAVLVSPDLAVGIVNIAGGFMVVLFVVLGVAARRKGHREAVWQFTTYSCFLLVTLCYTLSPLVSLDLALASRFFFYYGSVATLALMSLGIARRMNSLKSERERIKNLFGAYVSSQVVNQILHKQLTWEGEEREATVLFTDIRNYTALAETLSPREVIQILNEYFSVLVDTVNRNQGIVNKFMGDSIMALFNVPLDQKNHAQLAIASAREILSLTSNRRFGKGPDGRGLELKTNFGIHTGRVVVGNIGSASRLEYSVLGDTVNIASRLEQLNKELGTSILLSGDTSRQLDQAERTRLVNSSLVLRGRNQPCEVFTLENPD